MKCSLVTLRTSRLSPNPCREGHHKTKLQLQLHGSFPSWTPRKSRKASVNEQFSSKQLSASAEIQTFPVLWMQKICTYLEYIKMHNDVFLKMIFHLCWSTLRYSYSYLPHPCNRLLLSILDMVGRLICIWTIL